MKNIIQCFKIVCIFFINIIKRNVKICFGKPDILCNKSCIVFFPVQTAVFFCGIAGIVSFKSKKEEDSFDLKQIEKSIDQITNAGYFICLKENVLSEKYLGGKAVADKLYNHIREISQSDYFFQLYKNDQLYEKLLNSAQFLKNFIEKEKKVIDKNTGYISKDDYKEVSDRIETIKDIVWSILYEISGNIKKVKNLLSLFDRELNPVQLKKYKEINIVLNSIGYLEVRGRDSAGISIFYHLKKKDYQEFEKKVLNKNLAEEFEFRRDTNILKNSSISVNCISNHVGICFTYKIASVVGKLGDNTEFLRNQIKNDSILYELSLCADISFTVTAHTRWASVGAITESNCHPVDNTISSKTKRDEIIHVSLNGDIDNYVELKAEFEEQYGTVSTEISCDTKIIPLQIQFYIDRGHDIAEAFRLAVNKFKGSHAIIMHTDMAPGKLFLAQKGSGQAIFVGIADSCYIAASEVYGVVEETSSFIKLNGSLLVDKKAGVSGQIFILDAQGSGGMEGIDAFYYDNTPVNLKKSDIKNTEITSRDIDRQDFPHYFLKEISESPVSVEKTIQNCWKIVKDNNNIDRKAIVLDETVVPGKVKKEIVENRIKRIFFVGQGTAGVAAQACANIFNYYVNSDDFTACAVKSSELSGFILNESQSETSMSDTLVIGISQSGTTTDTNLTMDMVKNLGAKTLAIVNRRDSDITFKVDGVIYTSSGRDIEMSVASTKAFYSQIIAGAVLGLYISGLKNSRSKEFISDEIDVLAQIPWKMRKVLSMTREIYESASKLALSKVYWATVGSGPNKVSADEIRIKLSELCYKTISSDYIEDKKHIDLSSEPLIIVCAAGVRKSVINDVIKDTAIFSAHKAIPVVIADEGEDGFGDYSENIFHVPLVPEHLSPVLNTLVGHIWGYYAALAINESSSFLFNLKSDVEKTIESYEKKNIDIYETVLEKTFREKIALYSRKFKIKINNGTFPAKLVDCTDLILLLKYLSGRLPLSDFEMDFNVKGTAGNMINCLFEELDQAISFLTRPVDAIKHQAKTVTVGTTRETVVSDTAKKETGPVFDYLYKNSIKLSQISIANISVIRKLTGVISDICGAIIYNVHGLNILGEVTDNTTINIVKKEGSLKDIPSRVESSNELKGTKKIIVKEKNVYIGIGRKDSRSILIIPVKADGDFDESGRMQSAVLVLVNISFKSEVSLTKKIDALGGKYDRIKAVVNENDVPWKDLFLDSFALKDLYGFSAEKIGETVVKKNKS